MSVPEPLCPECLGRTIRRPGGEWCPACRGWVEEVQIFSQTISGREAEAVRMVQNHPR